jgi:regulator of cell morphogenesis and NO signaling
MTFNPSATVREIAQQAPLSIRLFEDIGIDYCCGGNKSLAEACRQAGVPLELALRKLSELNDRVADPDFTPWQEVLLSALTQHIVQTHHEYVRKEIPRLESLLDKVHERHGKAHPELTAMKLVFGFIAEELLNHMQKEEQVLFPYIARLEQASREGVLPPIAAFGSVARPVECMMRDHEKAGKEMLQIRELSKRFTVPDGACTSFRALYEGLREFDHDLHRHVYLENNILFPRAIELEAKACAVA